MTRSNVSSRLPSIALLAIAGGAGVYFAARAGGAGAAILAAVALGCAIALVVRVEPASVEALSVSRVFDAALLALPGIMTVYFAFDSGGYFPASPAVAALVLVVVLVLRVTLVDEPFAGFSRPLGGAVACLSLYCAWILASAIWSDAPARALIEFDRAFVYLLLLVLFGSVPRTSERLRWMGAWLTLGIVSVAVVALATRLYPDTFPTTPNLGAEELSYPLTYSNALGMLAVLGAIFCLYFATSASESRLARIAGSAALPILATTTYLSLSRGPVAAAVVGIAAFLVLGRPRGLLTGLTAALPTSVVGVASAYRHELLTAHHPPLAAAAAQGHRVATVVALCTAAAALVRLALIPLDDRLARFSLRPERRRPVIATASLVAIAAVLVIALAADAPSRIKDQYDRFVDTAQAGPTQDIRASIFDPANRGLIDNWSIALRAFGDEPLRGQGAGTYEVYWNRERPARQGAYPVTDGHSLYLEALGELGLVGFLLLVAFMGAILLSLAPLRRGPNRGLYAGLFAAAVALAVHAGVDWDWEMPALTAWLFALGGAGLAAHRRSATAEGPPQRVRVTIGLLLLVAALAPGLVLASQRQLDDGLDALRGGRCSEAIDRASASIRTLAIRPEPYQVIALCQAQRGKDRFAIQAMARAAKRDPENWRYLYDLSVLEGGAGLDPRPELLAARRLNPHQVDIRDLLATLARGEAVDWELDIVPPASSGG